MRKILFLLLVTILITGCTQVELYDEYNERWNLDLPRPVEVLPGLLKTQKSSPQSSENFDLYLGYNAVGDFSGKDFWRELSNEERHQLISDLAETHGISRTTAEGKRQELEERLGIDLGVHCKAFIRQQYSKGTTERIIMLMSKEDARIYLVHLID